MDCNSFRLVLLDLKIDRWGVDVIPSKFLIKTVWQVGSHLRTQFAESNVDWFLIVVQGRCLKDDDCLTNDTN